MFELNLTDEAKVNIETLKSNASLKKRYIAVKKALKNLAINPRHPGLCTHEYESLILPGGEKVFEAYAENDTPAAYRIFWCYGPNRGEITIIAITSHP